MSESISSQTKKKRPPKLPPFNQKTDTSGLDDSSNIIHVSSTNATSNEGSCNLDSTVSISIGDCADIHVNPISLKTLQHLGRGQYGVVEKVLHEESGIYFAVKRVPLKHGDDNERRRLRMDVDVLVKSTKCENIIKFYGALIWEGDLWILMELMDCSLDRFYKLAHKKSKTPTSSSSPDLVDGPISASFQHKNLVNESNEAPSNPIPEDVLGRMAADIVNALNYLYSIKVIHRDIKPSNILINQAGIIKLCDFGISGYLVNSVAQTYDAGCRPYMAPERIDPPRNRPGYDIKSDIWSFGITMVEIATGRYPYHHARNFFEQLKSICTDPPPRLPEKRFSPTFEDFIAQCLQKDYELRPKYDSIVAHKFIKTHGNVNISDFARRVILTE